MSRTYRSNKGIGYDYSSRRPSNKGGCNSPGPGVKRKSNKLDRVRNKIIIQKLFSNLE